MADDGLASSELCAVNTGLHADVVAFCPWARCVDVLACATYELRDGVRVGRLHLYSARASASAAGWEASESSVATTAPTLHAEAQFECAGIFDASWLPPPAGGSADGCLLALACADGGVECVRASRARVGGPVSLGAVTRCALPDASGTRLFCLTADWAWARDASAGTDGAPGGTASTGAEPRARLAACDNSGRAHIFSLDGASPELVCSWQAHSLEIWTATHQRIDGGLLLTGADDCALRGWDARAVERPAVANGKGHAMGVTSIHTDPRAEHIVLTGSYDEHVRAIDLRMAQRELCSIALGGGVWCARWHPHVAGAIVAACMHNGFHFARACEGHARLERVGACAARDVGDSLAYGADWSHEPPRGASVLGATCSFYDRTLRLWTASRAAVMDPEMRLSVRV
ncbi:hypothetical protein KFE25_002496 [Diacronema lutheri]|uniref:methylated diphthine methylhydrolase n=1 Tax=Diacronema lutheri TaxID=2081491 RepID=A0A8J5X8B0_DIALT|nr:hypothetical protein KFE25_002496 [Diacronema lutheri]